MALLHYIVIEPRTYVHAADMKYDAGFYRIFYDPTSYVHMRIRMVSSLLGYVRTSTVVPNICWSNTTTTETDRDKDQRTHKQ